MAQWWAEAAPAWVQALGSIIAIGLAIWIPKRERHLSDMEDLGDDAAFASFVIDTVVTLPDVMKRLAERMHTDPIAPGEEYTTWLRYERVLNHDVFAIIDKLAEAPLADWPDMELGAAFAGYAAPVRWLHGAVDSIGTGEEIAADNGIRIFIMADLIGDAARQMRGKRHYIAELAGRHIFRAEQAGLPLRYSERGTGWEMHYHPMAVEEEAQPEPEVIDAIIAEQNLRDARAARTLRGRAKRLWRWALRLVPRRRAPRYRGVRIRRSPEG